MLQRRWNNATSRERLLIIVMVVVVFCAGLIALLVRPAWRVVQSAPTALSVLDAKVLTMRAQAAQLRVAPAAGSIAAPNLQSAQRELAGPGATISEMRDARGEGQAATTVNFKGVESTQLAAWLARPEVQKQLLRLSITRDPVNGRAAGTVILHTPS